MSIKLKHTMVVSLITLIVIVSSAAHAKWTNVATLSPNLSFQNTDCSYRLLFKTAGQATTRTFLNGAITQDQTIDGDPFHTQIFSFPLSRDEGALLAFAGVQETDAFEDITNRFNSAPLRPFSLQVQVLINNNEGSSAQLWYYSGENVPEAISYTLIAQKYTLQRNCQ